MTKNQRSRIREWTIYLAILTLGIFVNISLGNDWGSPNYFFVSFVFLLAAIIAPNIRKVTVRIDHE